MRIHLEIERLADTDEPGHRHGPYEVDVAALPRSGDIVLVRYVDTGGLHQTGPCMAMQGAVMETQPADEQGTPPAPILRVLPISTGVARTLYARRHTIGPRGVA